jgi:acetoin utilization protein AcuC
VTTPLFIGSEIYRTSSYGAWHPLRIPRVSTVIDLSRALGWLPAGRYVNSPRSKPAALLAFHTPAYVDALQRAEAWGDVDEATRRRHNIGTTSNPVFPEIYRRPATAAGGSILAGELLRHPGRIYNPAGGTHHGMPDQASGFCYLNDPVLALLSLRRAGVRRIAYVDLDAHHGDGVEYAFAQDPDMLLVSVHEERRWPFTGAMGDRGAGQVWNLPVPRDFNDTEMRAVLHELILPRVAEHRAEALVIQCGADASADDPLSRLALSNGALWDAVAALMPLSPRVLALGGGGYNPWSVGRLWTGVWATVAGQAIPDRLPQAAEAVLRGLRWEGSVRGKNPPDRWFTTLRDLPREGPLRPEIRDRLAMHAARARAWV